MELIVSLFIPEAVDLLRDAYLGTPVGIKNYNLSEPFAYSEGVLLIADTYTAILEARTAPALDFGAHG
jgi:phosphoenolpyruvate carboxylase